MNFTTDANWLPSTPIRLAPHPGVEMFNEYIHAYKQLSDTDKAVAKLSNSEVYVNYCDAQKYGKQIYNVKQKQGKL
tara:strand:- start:134 stop:361 length:228 start_codon:yes stop_codon:yes gene_type:complete